MVCNKEKELQKDKQEEDIYKKQNKNTASIRRSFESSCK